VLPELVKILPWEPLNLFDLVHLDVSVALNWLRLVACWKHQSLEHHPSTTDVTVPLRWGLVKAPVQLEDAEVSSSSPRRFPRNGKNLAAPEFCKEL
jgi:hypothetical protein